MITKEVIDLYVTYGGDPDMWDRFSSAKEKRIISSNDWSILIRTQQDLILINNSKASIDYIHNFHQMVKVHFDTDETFIEFKKFILSDK